MSQAQGPTSPGVFAHWPNRITMLRFLGALVLFGIFAIYGEAMPGAIRGDRLPFLVAFVLFVVVAATDFLDGYLARRDSVVTAFGRIADPFTDKVLILGTMMYLAKMPWSSEFLPVTFVVAILTREFLVTGLRGYVESLGREFPADRFGKIKMVSQSVAVGAILSTQAFHWSDGAAERWATVVHGFVILSVLSTIASGVSYVLKTKQILVQVGGTD